MSTADIIGQVLAVVGVLATIVGAVAGAIKIYRDSHDSSESIAVSGLGELVEQMRDELKRLRRDHDDDRARIIALETQSETDHVLIRSLRAYLHVLSDYVAYVQDFYRNEPAGSQPEPAPQAPADLL